MPSTHWFGSPHDVRHLLETMRADKIDGEFHITGLEGGISGLFDSQDDVSIPMTARYYTNGEPHELAHELQIAGGGVMVGVY